MMEQLSTKTNLPWQSILPTNVHKTFSKDLIEKVGGILGNMSTDYYETVWVPGNNVLRSLKKAKLNVEEYNKIVLENDGNQSAVRTFKPIAAGYANEIRYDRFGTRTGRLTVESGPLVLTVKKEHRKRLLMSRYEGGKIIEVDFANLEPRVILHEAGKKCLGVDLYNELNENLFNGQGERSIIKGSVISQLYGMHKTTLKKKLNLPMKVINQFVDTIGQYFETANLLKKVKFEFIQKGHITNKFGRRIEIDAPLDRIFVNSWAQGTGSDVAMLGFDQIIRSFNDRKIKPLYLIVDALLLDVHPSDIPFVKMIRGATINGNFYPVKITEY